MLARAIFPPVVDEPPLSAIQLPVEIYLKSKFDSPEAARSWASEAASVLLNVKVGDFRLDGLDRLVLWGPPGADFDPSAVFMSEMAARLLRAHGVPVPATKVISVADLDDGLRMYVGGAADQQLYDRIKVN